MAAHGPESLAAVRAALERLVEAWNAADAAAFAGLFTADAEYVNGDGVWMRGRSAIAALVPDAPPRVRIDGEPSIRIAGAAARATFRWAPSPVVGPAAAPAESAPGGVVSCHLVLEEGAWRIEALQNTDTRGEGAPAAEPCGTAGPRGPGAPDGPTAGRGAGGDLPVACTLGEADLRVRREEVLRRVVARVRERRVLPGGMALRFDPDEPLLGDLLRLVEVEHACCAFLRFRLTVEPGSGPVWLDLTGPEGTLAFLETTFEIGPGADGQEESS